MYDQYLEWIAQNGPFDHVIVNGDAIDGTDKKGGGTECITTDRIEQCMIAEKALRDTGATSFHIVAGTPYHVGNAEDFERVLATKMDASFHGHAYFEIEGLNFNIKHKVAGASMPYLKATPLAKEIAQNRNWYLEGVEPKADVLIRSHVHHFTQVDVMGCLAFTTPSLQALGNRYGSRQCSGPVHFGLIVMEVENGGLSWKVCMANGEDQKVKVTKL
jgi:hypothetical protein